MWTNLSFPTRIFLTLTWTGNVHLNTYIAPTCTVLYQEDIQTISGTADADPDSPATELPGGTLTLRDQRIINGVTVYDNTTSQPAFVGGVGNAGFYIFIVPPTVTDTTETGNTFIATCGPSQSKVDQVDSPRVAALSNEYDLTLLVSKTVAALPPTFPNTTSGSYYNLTTDGRTLSIRESVYWISFPVPTNRKRPNLCYNITWDEVFYPDVGSPTITNKNWEWDGTIPGDYNPLDPLTWPKTPEYTISIPTSNGTTTVTNVVATCDDCE